MLYGPPRVPNHIMPARVLRPENTRSFCLLVGVVPNHIMPARVLRQLDNRSQRGLRFVPNHIMPLKTIRITHQRQLEMPKHRGWKRLDSQRQNESQWPQPASKWGSNRIAEGFAGSLFWVQKVSFMTPTRWWIRAAKWTCYLYVRKSRCFIPDSKRNAWGLKLSHVSSGCIYCANK